MDIRRADGWSTVSAGTDISSTRATRSKKKSTALLPKNTVHAKNTYVMYYIVTLLNSRFVRRLLLVSVKHISYFFQDIILRH